MGDSDGMNQSAVASLAGTTLLVVDDVPENLMVLGSLLRNAGYTVRVARSGAAALRYAALAPLPDLILLDLMMPGMDGYEVFQQLRANEATAAIPVIFLTALNQAQDVVRGLHMGAADYIVKPIEPEVVLARVRTQLEARQARDWLRDQNAFLEAEVVRRMAENRRIQDESERTQALLNHQRELILASAAEGIFGVDGGGIINFANPAAATLLGYGREDLRGRQVQEVLFPPGQEGGRQAGEDFSIRTAYQEGVVVEGKETLLWRQDGSPLAVEYSCTPILEEGSLRGAVITLQDISERKRYLEQLEHKSNYDDLTQLPNRNLLNDRLTHACQRSQGDGVAVLVLNLDRFKGINDSLGHGAGNQVLREAALRLRGAAENQHTLARIEGDEFVLVAEVTESAAVPLAQQMLQSLSKPFLIDEREFFLTGSIGIALFPRDGESVEVLLKNAMAAMYKAKGAGGDRFHFYAAEMNARSLERLELENGLRRAIDNDELVVHYQPLLSLRTGEIIGAEALVRWQHPERGLVMPGEFIPLAEECGLIVPLGEWVLRNACRQNKAWQAGGLPTVKVAVNLSARQFAAQDIVLLAGSILEETGLPPACLELELTESAVMADAEAFVHATERLKGLSIALTIDDFGTGFSSLNYLKRFSVDRLKIDQSFVRDIIHDANSAAIALAIISLAHSLKMLAIAEGVETEAQLNFLRARDCDEMQGFYFSKALPAAEFEAMLRQRRKLEFSSTSRLPQRTLLLVDDEPGVLSALKRLFRREGYHLLTAGGGMEALNLLASHEAGVVISDARMPEMSGAEFLGRARELYPNMVRIMLSGYTDLAAVTSAVNRGELFSFLTKPWDETELLDTVREAFRHQESRRQSHPGEQTGEGGGHV
ncbi:EAL domain-containing protein [Denitratisoma oestradiolicum]|uniref:Diguanylate cyclase n=1 Tax=Denitratisoma oestradiolicum TaxID=311182 RepID=A0A6S6YQT4_9PROT|nr:EAL domain-containing protein [Denitratisoma oestradiolicum]TWO80335.1 diguanylate cyclase [Denitratisoma oestradiolicum]CAB1370132.1 Diguanylate cyclase [Denitratisoma oestradiolicum]